MNPLKSALIKSAYKAFSTNEYKKVSTNDIVQDANVSKGLLFHYFKNKETLYLSLYEMAWHVIQKDVTTDFPRDNQDLFLRLKELILRKTTSLQKHQTLSHFMKRVHTCQVPHIQKERQRIYHEANVDIYKNVYEDLDISQFPHKEYFDEISKVVNWTLNRIASDWEKNHADNTPEEALKILQAELTHYIDFFRHFFY